MRILTLIVCLISLSLASAKEYLAVVENLNEHAPQFHTIEREGNTFFILVDSEDSSALEKLGYSVQIVDTDPLSKEYFLVFPQNGDLSIQQECDVLLNIENGVLVRGTAEMIHRVAEFPVDLKKLFYTPMLFTSRRSTPPIFAPETKVPLIQEIVDAVEMDSIRANVKTLQDFDTRYATSMENSDEVCPWLMQKLKDLGCDTVYYESFSHRYGPNVVGVKRGIKDSSLTTYCMIGGHLDSYNKANPLGYSPGADDNASGTSAVLEAARIMNEYDFENTIKYVLWNAEEVGLVGSEAMAQQASNDGDIIIGGVINFDMIGRTTPEYDYLVVTGPSEIEGGQEVVDVFAANAELYTNLKFQTQINNTSTKSDHASFWRQNYLAVYGIQSTRVENEVMHTGADTLDNPNGYNDSEFHTEVTKAGIATLADWAEPIDQSTSIETMATVSPFEFYCRNNEISLTLPTASSEMIMLTIYNLLGRKIYTKVVQSQGAAVTFPLNEIQTKGILIAEISSPSFTRRVKITLGN